MEEHSFIATIYQKTNPDLLQFCLFSCFLSQEEPKKISDALKDPSWVEAMQEELLQFKIQNVWILVDCPKGFPDRVYKVEKAMYGLHQAPRAWYGTLSKYLLANGFQRGTIDQTLFIRRHRGDFLLVQMYVDDIIIGSSNPQLCIEFEALMHDKFQMSAMGELNFFFGLQVLHKKDGIFLSQDKYVGDILKKFGYSDVRSANTPMDKENPWGKDGPGKDVELYLYRSIIGSLMYLTASRPDIMFAVCACARHQVTPKECHLHTVKRIFRYLKGHPKLGLWYPKESPFDLVAYSDCDYGGATQDRKSTTRGCQFLGRRLISWQCKKQTIMATSTTEAEYVAAARSVDGVTTSLQLSRNSRPPMLDHQDKYMMKAQVHVLKSFAISDEQPLPRKKYNCQNDKSIK
nr:putative ribonuclease H-like domain-containing protein [Tanacetum cinerariifolium]